MRRIKSKNKLLFLIVLLVLCSCAHKPIESTADDEIETDMRLGIWVSDEKVKNAAGTDHIVIVFLEDHTGFETEYYDPEAEDWFALSSPFSWTDDGKMTILFFDRHPEWNYFSFYFDDDILYSDFNLSMSHETISFHHADSFDPSPYTGIRTYNNHLFPGYTVPRYQDLQEDFDKICRYYRFQEEYEQYGEDYVAEHGYVNDGTYLDFDGYWDKYYGEEQD